MNRKSAFLPWFYIFLFWLVGATTLFFQSIRLDESQSLWIATKSVPIILQQVAQDVHVPLYLTILHFWIQLFGTDIIAARLLSSLFFLFTLPALYILAKESSNKKVAYLTVISFALSPFISWYSNETRMYTMFTLAATINSIYFLRFVRSEGRQSRFVYFLSTAIGFYIHYFFFILTFTQFIYVFGKYIASRATDRSDHIYSSLYEGYKRILKIHITLLLGAFLMFIPWLVYFVQSGFGANTSPLIPRPTIYSVIQTFLGFFVGFQTQWLQTVVTALWPISILLLFFIFTKRKDRVPSYNLDYFFLMSFLPVLLTFAVSFIRSIYISRYLIFVTPTLFFLVSWALLNNPKKFSRVLVLGLVTIMMGLLVYQNAFAASPASEDYAGVARHLEENAKPQDIIAVSAPFTIYPLEYVYSGPDRIVTIPYWDHFQEGAIPQFSETDLKKQITEYKKVYARIFLVLSYDQGYEKELVNYFEKNFHRLDTKKFPHGIQIRVYKLRYDI